MPQARVPRFDTYSRTQLIAATLVAGVPTICAFTVGIVLGDVGTGLLWAAVAAGVAAGVLAVSALAAFVGVLPAIAGASGVCGLLAMVLLWMAPSCPEWLGTSCGPREFATAAALGMLVPPVALVTIVPFPLGLRELWRGWKRIRHTNTGSDD